LFYSQCLAVNASRRYTAGKGPGDDDMLGEENFSAKKREGDTALSGGADSDDDETKVDTVLDTNGRIGGGIKLANRVLQSLAGCSE